MKNIIKKLALGLLGASLFAAAAFSQPAPGPGPTPNPWILIGNSLSYSQGGIILPSNVVGGSKGVGTINVTGNYYRSGAVISTTVNGQVCAIGGTCTISAVAGAITVSTTAITGGINNGLLYTASGFLGNLATGNNGVLKTSGAGVPSISSTLPSALSIPSPTFTGTVAGAGTIPNAVLANSSITIAGRSVALGGTQTLAASDLTNGTTGSGAVVLASGGTLVSPVITTTFTATGLVKNADLVNTATTVNGQTCTLGSTCTISASAGSLTIGTTTLSSGTDKFILYQNGASPGGTLGEYAISGSGTTVAMNTAPVITGGSISALTGLGIRSTGSAFDLTLASTEVFTTGRTLAVTLNDSARTLNMGGNITTANSFSTAGNFTMILTATAATNVTLPNTGTLATLAGAEALTNKSVNGLTITSSTGTFTLANSKTFAVNNSITLSGTDSTTITTPTTSATMARTDAAQTFVGLQTFATMNVTTSATITSASASALAVGLAGATNPAFSVDSSTASQAAGLKVTGAATGGTVALVATDSGSNTNLTINAKGTGTIGIGNVSTGGVTITPALTLGSTINKVTLTAPATSATLTIADGKTHVVSNSITLAGTDATTWTGPSTNATLASLNIAGQTLTGGATVTSQSLSAGSITVNCGNRPLQYITGSTSAWSITAPAADSSCMVLLTNAASSAVIPSFSGFTVGSNTGSTLTAIGSSQFTIQVWRINGVSGYTIFAHQ